MNWPEYMREATLARYLDYKQSGIADLVKRGVLPAAVKIGDTHRYIRSQVDLRFKSNQIGEVLSNADPYAAGAANVKTASSRVPGQKQDRQNVHLLAKKSRD